MQSVNYVGKTCPYCQFPIKPGEIIVVCELDHTPHHEECWIENEGCTIFGCTSKYKVPVEGQSTAEGQSEVLSESESFVEIDGEMNQERTLEKSGANSLTWVIIIGTIIFFTVAISAMSQDVPLNDNNNLVDVGNKVDDELIEPPKNEDTSIAWNNGVYKGKLSGGMPNGNGNWSNAKGDSYKGSFKNGEFNGHGVYTWADGRKYDGQWSNGKRHGQGVWSHPDGRRYSGGWANNGLEGNGLYIWPNGEIYEGQYKNNEKHGYGKWRSADGSIYEGELQYGYPDGLGTMTYSDGTILDGEWREGEYVYPVSSTSNAQQPPVPTYGYVDYYPYSGGYYIGYIVDGLPHGFGSFFDNNGNLLFEGNWASGKAHGYGQQYDSSGLYRTGYWVNGEYTSP